MRRSFASSDGGGNILPKQSLVVRRNAACGDNICASIIADRLVELGYSVNWQCHGMIIPLMKRVPSITAVSPYQTHCDISLDRAYEQFDGTPKRREIHFHQAFWDQAQLQLRSKGIDLGKPLNCRPQLTVAAQEMELAFQKLSQYEKPWVFICNGSHYFNVRTVPNYIWEVAAKEIVGTKFWIGLNEAPPGIVDLKCRDLDTLMGFLSMADLLISPDTGPAHAALSIGIQSLIIAQSSSPEKHFSDLNDYETVGLGLDCENCCLTKCPKGEFAPPCQNQNPEQIAAAANRKLRRETISAVVPTYNAPAERLNRCLNALLPQVDEIIVTGDANAHFPIGALKHSKIKYARSGTPKLGFGRNVNHGVRHTSGNLIWCVNDDFFAQPDVAAKLKSMMGEKVGMATHLIRYEDGGRIYYGSKPRGQGGFYHLDHNQFLPSVTGTFEVENACGCSFMLNREAFYDARCFDEEFQVAYAEDDALAMQLRSKGWKLLYTSEVFGHHIGSATTTTFPDKDKIMHESNILFGKKWANRYLEHNRNVPNGKGNFDYLKA